MIEIGEAARRSGVGIETIRFYERSGVVPKAKRAANGRRVFSEAEIGRLRFLRKCRDLGFPLAESRTLLQLSEAVGPDCDAASAFAEAHIRNIEVRIAALRTLEAALRELAGNCRAGNLRCPMLDKLRQP